MRKKTFGYVKTWQSINTKKQHKPLYLVGSARYRDEISERGQPWVTWGRENYTTPIMTRCSNVCQWPVAGRWFSPGTRVSSNNKTDRHDIAEILLKVSSNTITPNSKLHHITNFWIDKFPLIANERVQFTSNSSLMLRRYQSFHHVTTPSKSYPNAMRENALVEIPNVP